MSAVTNSVNRSPPPTAPLTERIDYLKRYRVVSITNNKLYKGSTETRTLLNGKDIYWIINLATSEIFAASEDEENKGSRLVELLGSEHKTSQTGRFNVTNGVLESVYLDRDPQAQNPRLLKVQKESSKLTPIQTQIAQQTTLLQIALAQKVFMTVLELKGFTAKVNFDATLHLDRPGTVHTADSEVHVKEKASQVTAAPAKASDTAAAGTDTVYPLLQPTASVSHAQPARDPLYANPAPNSSAAVAPTSGGKVTVTRGKPPKPQGCLDNCVIG